MKRRAKTRYVEDGNAENLPINSQRTKHIGGSFAP